MAIVCEQEIETMWDEKRNTVITFHVVDGIRIAKVVTISTL